MPKKKTDKTQENETQVEIPVAQPVDEIEGSPEAPTATEEPKKEWTKRPDPFESSFVNWKDGYRITLNESDSNREIYVQFGNGTKGDSPKNFEAIKKMFKEHGMYWDPKVLGWAKGLKLGVAPLIREQNRDIRASVHEAFNMAVDLEEASRGPSLAPQGRQQGGQER